MLRGIDPHRLLSIDDPIELAITTRAATRAHELRQQELAALAEATAAEVVSALARAMKQ